MTDSIPAFVLCALLAGPALAQGPSAALVDPTRPDGGASYVPAGPVLQSTMVSPGRKLAIISGRVVVIGENVGRAIVTDIRPYEVTLTQGGRETHLRVVPRLDRNTHFNQATHDHTDR